MSNSAIGQLYKRIIDQVVDSSRADFEENGVGIGIIKTFQETWQGHLSERKTAPFPWDPIASPTEQEQPTHAPQGQGKNITNTNGNISGVPPQRNNVSSVHIKQEPGIKSENSQMNMPAATGFSNAQERAEALVQQRRMDSLNGLQPNPISLPAQQGQPGFANLLYPNQQQLYQQQQQAQRAQQQWSPQQQHRPDIKPASPQIKQERADGLGIGGTDGVDETSDPQTQWSAIMAANRETKADAGKISRIDGMMKRQVAEHMRHLQAGGLLVPIDERYTVAERKGIALGSENQAETSDATSVSKKSKGKRPRPVHVPGVDGPDDDDGSVDRDAINSDLDDPEDDLDDGTVGEEYEGDTIICLYDKVQRVKNKWKCVLKDGVVNADGKDYVFHKANGEFEW